MISVSEPDVPVLPHKRHIPSLVHFTADEKHAFADIMSRVTKRYDNLFSCSFAYAMGIHQRPLPPCRDDDGVYVQDADDIAHLHVHFEPPLLRSASVRKFLAGCVLLQFVDLLMQANIVDRFEVMAEPQRDLTPEQAAKKLRDCSEVHYLRATA